MTVNTLHKIISSLQAWAIPISIPGIELKVSTKSSELKEDQDVIMKEKSPELKESVLMESMMEGSVDDCLTMILNPAFEP